MSDFIKVSDLVDFPKTIEKAIEILKERKKMSRLEFWNLLKDEIIAENVLYSLFLDKKIKMQYESDHWEIEWNENEQNEKESI